MSGSLLTTVLFVVIIYFIFKRVVRLFTVSFMGERGNDEQQDSKHSQNYSSGDYREENGVKVKYNAQNKSRINVDSAENIDFEEID